jgi:predicted transcriptional regulator
MERFYDTLFEISNDYRHNILLLLKEKPLKITEISKRLNLTTQEISRHISRLSESGLVVRDVEGFHHLTNYGKLIHVLLEEFEFVSKYRDYFNEHSVQEIDPEFVKRLGDLSSSRFVNNTMEFLHFIDKLIRDSKDQVWFQVDQYPLTSLASIIDGLRRGVKFRVIEQSEVLSGPRVNLGSIEEAETLVKTRGSGLSEQRTLNESGVFLFLSEKDCAVAFPSKGASFDYKGFISSDQRSVKWCSDLFSHYWEKTGANTLRGKSEFKPTTYSPSINLENGVAVIQGTGYSTDTDAIQYAVDHHDDILLKGVFDLGPSSIVISKSVKIRGEKWEKTPLTRIMKRGWPYPLTKFDSVFEVNGRDIDVLIENIHFTDFDCSCINGISAKSLRVRNNKITLETGHGRGWKHPQYGDLLYGIYLDPSTGVIEPKNNFVKGVSIEGNYIDFEESRENTISANVYDKGEKKVGSEKIKSFEYYQGIGLSISNFHHKVEVKNNVIRNANAHGISVLDNFEDAEIVIINNSIHSEVSGSYPYRGVESGAGIFIQGSFVHQRPGFAIDIRDNKIRLLRPDYCGIIAIASMKLMEAKTELRGNISNNDIHLEEGQAGIKVGSEDLDVTLNRLSGEGFFGVIQYVRGLPGSLLANEESDRIKKNDISNFGIIDPRRWVSRRWPI